MKVQIDTHVYQVTMSRIKFSTVIHVCFIVTPMHAKGFQCDFKYDVNGNLCYIFLTIQV